MLAPPSVVPGGGVVVGAGVVDVGAGVVVVVVVLVLVGGAGVVGGVVGPVVDGVVVPLVWEGAKVRRRAEGGSGFERTLADPCAYACQELPSSRTDRGRHD